jgi:hypothetical protein
MPGQLQRHQFEIKGSADFRRSSALDGRFRPAGLNANFLRTQFSRNKLRAAVAVTPVGVGIRDDRCHHIARVDAAAYLQLLAEIAIKVQLLFLSARSAEYCHEYRVFCSLNSQPCVFNDQIGFGVPLIDLMSITLWHLERRQHRTVQCVEKGFYLVLTSTFKSVHSNQRHWFPLFAGDHHSENDFAAQRHFEHGRSRSLLPIKRRVCRSCAELALSAASPGRPLRPCARSHP